MSMNCVCRGLIVCLIALTVLVQPAAADPQCKCRLYNKKLEIGTITCIKGKLARCQMFENTPSWKYLSQSCPVSQNNMTPRFAVGLGES